MQGRRVGSDTDKESFARLRQVDIKAEHYERQVARIEQERDSWETKFEEAQSKYLSSKRELEELASQVRGFALDVSGISDSWLRTARVAIIAATIVQIAKSLPVIVILLCLCKEFAYGLDIFRYTTAIGMHSMRDLDTSLS